MPEAAAYLYYSTIFWEHNVRCPRQLFDVKSVSVAFRVKEFSHPHLGFVFFEEIRAINLDLFSGKNRLAMITALQLPLAFLVDYD